MRYLGGILVLLAALVAWGPVAGAADTGVPTPHPVKAFKGDKCVEPADVMRRDHMEFLLHQRDETVQDGVRGEKYSLRQCIGCHAQPDKEAGGARTAKAFCSECHEYAAVKIDCFGCHTNRAEDAKTSRAAPPGHGRRNGAGLGLGGAKPTRVAEIERYLTERSDTRVQPR